MGLVEISEKMTTSVTIPTTSSKSPASSSPNSSSSMNNNTNPTSSTSPDQVLRKKRTFDIAFLTGQSDNESGGDNDNLDRDRSRSSTGLCSTSNNNNEERKCAVNIINVEHQHRQHHHQQSSGVNRNSYNPKEEDGTNSDGSSSIDVMTNGSLSESESQHSPSSSIPERCSPPFHSMLLIHHQQQLSRANGPSSPHYSSSNGSSNTGLSISHRSSSHNSNYDHHHHHLHNLHHGDIKSNRSSSPPPRVASTGNKTRNNRSPVKEEIRFESRRIIDINQTVDSLKIKENLQFSTLLPSSAASIGINLPNNGGSNCGVASERGDLTLPHLASTIALLPHVARFPLGLPSLASGVMPGNHMPKNIPFHAKMEKSESINISYPKLRGGAFPDPYAVLAASASTCGYPYPNIGIPPELGRHPSFPNPLGSPGGSPPGDRNTARGMHSPGSNGGGQQVSNQPPHSQQPPPPAPSTTSVPPCGMSPSATLLPPSLTSLTLPAQNVCAKCNIGFRMTSDLVYHMRSHHKRDTDPMKKQREEKLKCPVCHETFRERHHLTRHMTAHQDRAEES